VNDSYKIIVLIAIIIFLTFLLPFAIKFGGQPKRVIDIIFINFFCFVSYYLILTIYRYLFLWFWFHKHKNTKLYNRAISIAVACIILLEIPFYFFHANPEEILYNNFFTSIIFGLQFTLILLTFLQAKRNDWIASLAKTQKRNLIFVSILMIILSIVISTFEINNSNDGKFYNALYNLFPIASILPMFALMLIAYHVRLFFSAMIYYPSTKLFEKRTSEISSLTFLNKLVSQTIELDKLIETVTKLSLFSSGATFAWNDKYDSNNKLYLNFIEISHDMKISMNELSELLNNNYYSDELKYYSIASLSEPLYIESLSENKALNFSFLGKNIPAKSLIILPLQSGDEKIGNIYLIHNDEYGFDGDYMNILSAFSDNINIAIENARLLQESIEKEKYKRELKIAHDIEAKLIPLKMPEIENYKFSAFTITADEVGGDYYDFVRIKDGSLCALIGDVSGKGMSAAFYMVLLKGVVLGVAKEAENAKDLLCKINLNLYQSMDKQMYITMSAIVIKNNKGLIELSRAGHMPFLHKSSDAITTITPKGIGIGLTSSEKFDENLDLVELQLSNGDNIIMYSDGITELRIDDRELNIEYLKQIMKNSVYTSNSNNFAEILKEDIVKISIDNHQHDDMTVVSLSYFSKE
jgi:serine phosphatase RsbU (regulator of sigma subunit)